MPLPGGDNIRSVCTGAALHGWGYPPCRTSMCSHAQVLKYQCSLTLIVDLELAYSMERSDSLGGLILKDSSESIPI